MVQFWSHVCATHLLLDVIICKLCCATVPAAGKLGPAMGWFGDVELMSVAELFL